MKKFIPLAIFVIILIVVDTFALKGIGTTVAAHNQEVMADYFQGSVLDWIGLVGFNILCLAAGIGMVIEPEIYNKKGSSALTVGFFVVALVLVGLIYLA